jgi:MFS transporter, DHA3 family, macrolide efflux protein
MLLIAMLVGVGAGLLAGGRIANLLSLRLRFGILIVAAIVLRFGTQSLLAAGVDVVDQLRVPLLGLAFGLLVVTLWLNRSQPGMLIAMVGVALNALAILLNGGWMPVYLPALAVAGIEPSELSPTFHVALPETLDLEFLLRGGPIGDVLPLPLPLLANVISVGDVLLAAGVAWLLFTGVAFGRSEPEAGGVSLWRGRVAPAGPTTVTLDRPLVLGGGMGPGLGASPSSAFAAGAPAAADVAVPIPALPRPSVGERIREHPYVRLARDARFTAFWLAQVISLYGDRLHQIALGVLVYGLTGSPLQTGLVFLAATLPNLFLGPIAGTFVDRWDQKRVLIVSDLVRAALVLTIPFVVEVNLLLVYPLVFTITAVSLFFRPAKAAIVPRIVRERDLIPANAALWTGETLADIGGYPLAGLFVAFLGANLALAFWVDAVTYVVSAALIVGMVIPPALRRGAPKVRGAIRAFSDELVDGWRVLRRDATLFQNTIVSAVAHLSVGATLALTVVYARDTLEGRVIPYPESYAAIETAIGVGNLIGGFVVGAIGARLRKGWLVVIGFVAMGAATVVMGLTSNELLALAAAAVIGVFNLVYVIPTQTLFMERTPEGFIGRVIAFRTSLVMGALTGAMAVSAGLAEAIDAGLVIAGAGVITVVAGLVAAVLPAVRDA